MISLPLGKLTRIKKADISFQDFIIKCHRKDEKEDLIPEIHRLHVQVVTFTVSYFKITVTILTHCGYEDV